MKKLLTLLWLFLVGGFLYYIIEIAWRGYSHPAMIFVGGLCFVLIGLVNEWFTYDMPLWLQGLIAMLMVLLVELLSGVVLNIWFRLDIWDYSALPFNVLGQIQLYFAGAWYVLSLVGIFIDDYVRYLFFDEEKPHYKVI